ncbi:dihydrodipicolinate synthase family protein [Oceanobacillus bengalensis]|uniref:Dihydrodipicolinate synthase family protein n=1 Tax=Oceanobacillus bengalensis TaxID=1435466 RepID=A0A494YTY3_9BACI|nr:dihydrodipicolinate synthase family protein [Oceanobacillus bengalensis]RKQ13556.1 dihydrodipicolinate synthase family protein [Oceanobacillus bengalensis]
MDYAQFSKRFSTISAINIVPFYPESKAINWEGLDENVEFLIRHGVEVVVPNGNTGEFYALNLEEAKQVTKRVTEVVGGRATVVAGVGYSVDTAIELGVAAQDAGADCVMIHQPIHPYITEDGAVAYFQKIIDALDIPSIIYFKDSNLSDNVIKRLAPLEKLIGVKYAINDVQRVTKLIRDVPEEYHIAWICGTAEKWAPFFYHSGAVGFTSGLVNVFPEKSFALLEALQQGNQEAVWDIWEEVEAFEDLRAMHHNGNNVVVIKEAMEQLGLTAGVTREPVEPLTEHDKALLSELLNRWKVVR